MAVTDNESTHSNITLQRSHDIGSLLLLVPTDESVKQKNTTDNTEIDPVTQTTSETDSKFHNCRARVSRADWLETRPEDTEVQATYHKE